MQKNEIEYSLVVGHGMSIAIIYCIRLPKRGMMKKGDCRKVQIKVSQQDNIVISHEPNYLIVMYLRKDGVIFEVYTGPGKLAWDTASKRDSHNNMHMLVNKLMELDKSVPDDQRIKQVHYMPKMQKEFKNREK